MIKPYASYFVSFLLNTLKNEEIDKIKSIILFGSVAQKTATKNSDVDLFIETFKKSRSLEIKIKQIIEEFYKSREAMLFKVKGIDSKINILIGKLSEWKELKESIESTGIVLYGNYIPSGTKGRKYAVFFWDNIKKNRGAFLNKLYGFSMRGKKYSGLVESYGGKKLGKSSIIVPVEYREEIIKLLKHYQVSSKIMEVYY